jgi:hypothetical protein
LKLLLSLSAIIDNPEDRDWKRCGKSNDAGVTSVMRLNHETKELSVAPATRLNLNQKNVNLVLYFFFFSFLYFSKNIRKI